jgi:hypothetical protein
VARILKYELHPVETNITVGGGSFPLCVEAQIDKPFVWIAVNEESTKKEEHIFMSVMTGERFPPIFLKQYAYLGTIHRLNGWMVVHVYWRRIVCADYPSRDFFCEVSNGR